MAEQIKNILAFNLGPGDAITLAHGLKVPPTDVPVIPDVAYLPSPQLSLTATDTEATITNNGPTALAGSVLVEYWHTTERAFGDAAVKELSPRPYLVVGAEGGNAPPQPAFVSPHEVITIYVRATGSNANGDGKTIPTAYRTVQRAAQDIPNIIPGGVYYVIDTTDLIAGGAEVLPPNYALPPWKSSVVLAGEDFDRNNYRGAVTVHAEPRNVPALGADAVIVEADLDSTAVGGAIVSASNATPILITTTTPHGLVESPPPFGIFGVFAGVVQIVEIAGVVGNPEANGVFFALVTKPTVDESTTFELYDLNLNPVAGSGAGAGGTVTVLLVKDQHSGQTQIKVSAPRASWLPNDSLKGKMLVGAGDSAFIYANTADTLYLASNGEPGIFTGPVRIAEPSCALQCSDSEVFSDDGFVGGFNVVGVDSICLSGIQVLAAPDGSSFLHSGGVCLVRECSLELPKFVLQGRAISMESHLITPSYNRSAIEHDRCLVENVEGGVMDYWDAFHGTVIIQDADHTIPSGTLDWIMGVKVISQADPVFAIENGGEIRWWCGSIEGGAGDAIVIRAQGDNQLYNVGGSGWVGTALVVDVGAQVEVNAFSFLKTDEMLVGQLAARTFDDFRTSVTFPLEQFDVTYDPTAGAPTKATGTASRAFEQP